MQQDKTVLAEELVDWVDEDEHVIKPIPISLANNDPKYLHIEVAILVVDSTHRVLLQQRSKTKKVAPNIWTTTAAGHVTHGDTTLSTANKELCEEMGINTHNFVYLFKEKSTHQKESHITYWYLAKYNGDKIVIEEKEVQNYAWISHNEWLEFVQNNQVSSNTERVVESYWSGEWDSSVVLPK